MSPPPSSIQVKAHRSTGQREGRGGRLESVDALNGCACMEQFRNVQKNNIDRDLYACKRAYLNFIVLLMICDYQILVITIMGICIKRSQPAPEVPLNNIQNQPNRQAIHPQAQPNQTLVQSIQTRPTNIITHMEIQPPRQDNQSGQESNTSKLKMSLKLQALKRLSLTERRQTNNDNLCDICYEKYDILTKWPMQVCSNEHYICDQCVKDFHNMYQNQPYPCPLCRQLIFQYKIKPYRKLFKSLNNLQNLKEKMKSEQLQLYYFAFQHQLYEIARAYKDKQEEKIKELRHLSFQNRLIQTFPYFNRFPKVRFLQLQCNNITKCQFLQPLCKTVKILNLSRNQIQCLDVLDQFQSLSILACQYNKIKTLTLTKNILSLKQLFIIGNHLQNIADFQTQTFLGLTILSIQSVSNQVQATYLSSIKKQGKLANAPKLQTLIISDSCKKGIDSSNLIKVMVRQDKEEKMNLESESYLPVHLLNYYKYGNIFKFQPDQTNPQSHQYSFQANTLTKITDKFTNINSTMVIPATGKQTLRLKINEKNNNLMVGVCTANIRHNCSVYSNEFIGLTLWGAIYNRAEQMPYECQLRLHDNSIITMTVDFDNYSIVWHIDQSKIGQLQRQQYFLIKSQLYFNIGIRDSGIKMQFTS